MKRKRKGKGTGTGKEKDIDKFEEQKETIEQKERRSKAMKSYLLIGLLKIGHVTLHHYNYRTLLPQLTQANRNN